MSLEKLEVEVPDETRANATEGRMQFTEYEGMILLESAEAAERGVRRWEERGIPFFRWRYERGANHVHAQMSALDREHVRQEMEIAAEFEAALLQAYPDRDFVISHIPCYAVTFYQLLDDALTENEVLREVSSEPVWCQNCRGKRAFRLLPEPDPEFPWLTWGACTVCNNDLVLGTTDFRGVVRATTEKHELGAGSPGEPREAEVE